jgi:hypothetical protein
MIRAAICTAALLATAHAGAEWRYEEAKDDATGKTAYLLQTESSVAARGSGGKELRPLLQLRCDEDGGQAYWRIHWFAIVNTMVSRDDSRKAADKVRLQARVDGKRDMTGVWSMTRDPSLESTSTDRAQDLVKTLRGASEVKVSISGDYGKSYDAAFDVTGLDGALTQLKRRCKKL